MYFGLLALHRALVKLLVPFVMTKRDCISDIWYRQLVSLMTESF